MRAKSDLRGYQQRTITHLYETDATQAVIPMGGGKTAAALTAADELIRDGVTRCGLLLAPKKVAQLVWPKEPNEWEHLQHLVISLVKGDEAERLAALAVDADIYSCGIHHLPWLVKHLKTLPEDHKLFDLLIIDESSKLKAPRGKWGRSLTGICRRWKIKWWLTGTPRPNGYEDQFRPLAILTGGKLWGTLLYDKWREKHFQRVNPYSDFDWFIRPEHEAKIIRKIQSVTFTIDDSEMPELDPVTNVYHWVDLPPAAMQVYKEMEKKMVARYGGDPAVIAANAGVATGKLCQIAQGFMYGDDRSSRPKRLHDMKTDELVRLTDELSGFPVSIVYDFIEDLDVMRELWPGLPYLGDDTNDEDAERFEREWNQGKLPRFALHPGSAAHGLNLQFGGQQIIFYGMPWSAELYDQIIKRIHRPGQNSKVFAHHILARGTMDEVKLMRVQDKISDQEAFRRYLRKV